MSDALALRGTGARAARRAADPSLTALLATVSWPELRANPWRNLTALFAVMLGVALAFSVQLINESALSEFSAAVRSVNGQADVELRSAYRGVAGGFDEALYARAAAHPQVALASPVAEVDTYAIGADGTRVALRVLGIDALVAGALNPAALPQPFARGDRQAVLDPDAVFLNAAARQALGVADAPKAAGTAGGAASSASASASVATPPPQRTVRLQTPDGTATLRLAGTVALGGAPTAVIDIAGAQAHFGLLGRLSRIEVRLAPGADREAVARALALPAGVRAAAPEETAERVSNVSRAYRVNLTVLALVALFTGAFLVFSVLSLAVTRRLPQFALLGVLGLGARERLAVVVAEAALLGLAGAVLGLALGTALAALALRWLAGDLGGGYFPGVAPALRFSPLAALGYGALGVAAAVAGGWLPARRAARIAPAQALKGHGSDAPGATGWRAAALGPLLLAAGGALALAPPLGGLPVGAYLSVACLLLGGIVCVPAAVGALLRGLAPSAHPLVLLAVERARRQRETATIAVAGVVASLALSVALTVMVTSFRGSVAQWLDTLLPADLYVRGAGSTAAYDSVFLAPAFVDAVRRLPQVARVETQRVTQVQLDPRRAAVALIARPVGDAARALPLVGELRAAPPGATPVYASEAMAMLYGAVPGATLDLPLADGRRAPLFVRGVWRDYARQQGALLLEAADWQRLTGDARVNDLAIWLKHGATAGAAPGGAPADARSGTAADADARAEADVQRAVVRLAGAGAVEFSSVRDIRRTSLDIFDRSFAVTYWLQAVAVGIGLVGVAASFSSQVLARRKELGLLAHLGLTRRQIVAVVAAEGAVWTASGALLGLALGIAVSVVLVAVVNPQSFHWTMDLILPWPRLAALCAAVVGAGTLTAWGVARATAGAQSALAVKEDW